MSNRDVDSRAFAGQRHPFVTVERLQHNFAWLPVLHSCLDTHLLH